MTIGVHEEPRDRTERSEREGGLQGGRPHSARTQATGAPGGSLPDLLYTASLDLRRKIFDLESASGLSGRELDLISLLCQLGPTSVKDLVADLRLPRSTMTAVVDRLEKRGLVTRRPNPQDRRSIVLDATPTAADALERYRKGVHVFVEHFVSQLSEEDRGALAGIVHQLARMP
ncbi:MAG: MarR family transcriptional regulator [Deltaproteobacteria bacterium]|jgi:DNA-binding MarR family transcriptional regulator|nr:MarR family transcriptional regulator [Deltaproteobacteria bacterium]MBW2496760.1 MarR family transcriptional regulator [Deltaproteobacteria bacterium]